MKSLSASTVADVLLVGGTASLVIGFARLWGPLGWIVGGALALFAGWRLAK